MIIDDIVAEVAKIQDSMNAIKEALKTKGVTSQGKLNKFAEEIKSIKAAASTPNEFDEAIKAAKSKGYTNQDIKNMLINIQEKPLSPEDRETVIPAKKYFFKTGLSDIYYRNVTEVRQYAFAYCDAPSITLPKAVTIAGDAFQGAATKTIEIPNFVLTKATVLDLSACTYLKTLIVSDNSNLTGITKYQIPYTITVYNSDKSKQWDFTTNSWK